MVIKALYFATQHCTLQLSLQIYTYPLHNLAVSILKKYILGR